MLYQSTRGEGLRVESAHAILYGQAPDGGLYVPEKFPAINNETIMNLIPMSYSERAAYLISMYLSDFDRNELDRFTTAAYGTDHDPAPVKDFNETTKFLELWHGPTCAFKDMALQLMPYLLTSSGNKIGEKRTSCILIATSGDTGKAALEGFRDVPGTRIMVFYPQDGVSEIQKLQMTTQEGMNVNVAAINGNFDDAQTGVKKIFADKEMTDDLNDRNVFLSSANSINWGRLVPQIVYYISAYCDLIRYKKIKISEKINFCVPTGNFGNILAGYYAKKMGLPINKLICASNRNDVLNQFITTGTYDRNRMFYTTASPAMDILISSNLERLLFELSGKDSDMITGYMSSLANEGKYSISDPIRNELCDVFISGYCSEEDTMKTIKTIYNKNDYLIDTHTAVAYKVLEDYKNRSGDDTVTVVVSTANPFKFCDAVLNALGGSYSGKGLELLDILSEKTGIRIPGPLADLKNKTPRFNKTVSVNDMKSAVKEFIGGI